MKKPILLAVILMNCGILFAQEKGTFTDPRDGRIYKTVKIGTQTWMAENMAYKDSVSCWAYGKNQMNIVDYGYIYNWEAAQRVSPPGWHLPTKEEWTTLTDYLGGKDADAGTKMKSNHTDRDATSNGTDESGFNGFPAGFFNSLSGNFQGLNSNWWWWSVTEFSPKKKKSKAISTVWCCWMMNMSVSAFISVAEKEDGMSVRCIRDN